MNLGNRGKKAGRVRYEEGQHTVLPGGVEEKTLISFRCLMGAAVASGMGYFLLNYPGSPSAQTFQQRYLTNSRGTYYSFLVGSSKQVLTSFSGDCFLSLFRILSMKN